MGAKVGGGASVVLFLALTARGDELPARAKVDQAFEQMPLYFVENRGQVDREVSYYVEGRDQVYFTARGATFALSRAENRRWAVAIDLVGARRGLKPEARERTDSVVSYFKGPRAEWKTAIPTFTTVDYREAWPGIDVRWSGTNGRMEDTFLVRPGADPHRIRLRYRGASAVTLAADGGLAMTTPAGGFRVERPRAYQELEGSRREVAVSFALEDQRHGIEYGFRLGPYDRDLPLVIDPVVLAYCGYIGGFEDDGGHGIAVDGAGNAYVTGDTSSMQTTFPVKVGPDLSFNGIAGTADAFVVKVRPDGAALVYAGYIGGDGNDSAYGIAVDGVGSAYITGITASTQASFPVAVGPDLSFNGGAVALGDAFVAKVASDGTTLVYAGYLGGEGDDAGYGIVVDTAGNAYVSGATSSTEASFPVSVGPDLSYNGGSFDAFVAKVKADGTGLVYAGYVGGIGQDRGGGIAVDGSGNAYLTGETFSSEASFPVAVGPDQSFNDATGTNDAFVAKVKADGTGLVYAGYIGGDDVEFGSGIALDSDNNAYVTGGTWSSEATFPVSVGPDLQSNGSIDAFVAKVKADGTGLVYAGYIGGSDIDVGYGIAVDGAGSAYLTGQTSSSEGTFPVIEGPDLSHNGGSSDAFVVEVKADGTGLVYAGYIGGDDFDIGRGIAVDGAGNAYVAGLTGSTEATFPVARGPELIYNGGTGFSGDAFVVKVVSSGLCSNAAVAIARLKAVKPLANHDSIDFTWDPDSAANGYNIWYVPLKADIPSARQTSSPPATPVAGCSVPSPASGNACTDVGAVSRGTPTMFFYQVHSYCDAKSEGP